MPKHMAEWGEPQETYEGWQAMWTTGVHRAAPIRGCPLWRGRTEKQAIRDLVRRTNAESGTNLSYHA